ncbi:hypothetical protein [Neobacillus drentensis]|uniref:hypothetical protein n=1 Tax=Neobacillus drentensis TaxID=220684 RepID=UPI003000FA56
MAGFFIVIVIVNVIKKELEEHLYGIKAVKMKKKKDIDTKVVAYSSDKFDFVQK